MTEAQRDFPCDAAVHAMLSTLIECGYSSNQINAAFAKLGYHRASLQPADQARDAARYRWLAAQARTEDRDGGYTGFWRLPYIDGWNDTPYAHNRGEGFNFRSDFAAALDAAMATKEAR